MYLQPQNIRELHLEITNKCNAACPMCDRNYFGGALQPGVHLTEWQAEDAARVFVPELRQLRNVLFCGTHGDPAAARDALELVEYVKTHTAATVEFYSNGGLRSPDWWARLGALLQQVREEDAHYRQTDLGVFSVDGLSDTNHLYRRGTDFKKIMVNAQAFIGAGGLARWDFIVFKHNEHQVEEARELAMQMGFQQFRIRKTARFNYSPLGPERWPVLSKEGAQEYVIEPPSRIEYINTEVSKFEELRSEGLTRYFDQTPIRCLYREKFQRMYVNSELRLFPCCYLGNDVVTRDTRRFFRRESAENIPTIREDSMNKVFSRYGREFNDLRLKSWKDITQHPWFAEGLEQSWGQKLDEGRLRRCARTCGTGYKPITSQSRDQVLRNDGPKDGHSQSRLDTV